MNNSANICGAGAGEPSQGSSRPLAGRPQHLQQKRGPLSALGDPARTWGGCSPAPRFWGVSWAGLTPLCLETASCRGGGARAGCWRVPAERAMPRGGGGGRGAVPACPALVARRGCAAVAGLAEPARSGEPGRRGGNASVIKGTRETWSQQLVAARDTSAKPDPGIAKPAPAPPASRRPGPAPALPTRAGWHGRGTAGRPIPGTQSSPTGQHALVAGATSRGAGSAPKKHFPRSPCCAFNSAGSLTVMWGAGGPDSVEGAGG